MPAAPHRRVLRRARHHRAGVLPHHPRADGRACDPGPRGEGAPRLYSRAAGDMLTDANSTRATPRRSSSAGRSSAGASVPCRRIPTSTLTIGRALQLRPAPEERNARAHPLERAGVRLRARCGRHGCARRARPGQGGWDQLEPRRRRLRLSGAWTSNNVLIAVVSVRTGSTDIQDVLCVYAKKKARKQENRKAP